MSQSHDHQMMSFYKSLNDHLKVKAASYEGLAHKSLRLYQKGMAAYSKKKFTGSSFEAFTDKVTKSQIVYVGDFHTFDQSSKNFIRLLRFLKKQKKKMTIAVEFISSENQKSIDHYLEGMITEIEFLEEIDYKESWKFPWIHYRPIFDLAKKFNIQIIGLNSQGDLNKRDLHAAKILSEEIASHPQHLILVLFGELHIVPDKLPAKVDSKLKKKSKKTILHQNLEEVFWRIPATKLSSKSSFWKINSDEFVLQNSPPWIKYESMIYWYENLCDDPDFDLHEYILETGTKVFNSSVTDNFLYLSKMLNEALGLNLLPSDIEDFNLYDLQSLHVITKKIKKLRNLKLEKFYNDIIKNGRVFRISFSKDYYCSHYTINRMTFLAGQHLFALKLFENDPNLENEIFDEADNIKRFNFFLLQSLFSYYCSKLINPYRKCNHYIDFKQRLSLIQKRSLERKIIESTLDFMDNPEHVQEKLKRMKWIELFLIARHLGYSLGDIAYEKDIQHQTILESLKDIFSYSLDMNIYQELVKTIEPKKSQLKSKKKSLI
ncbi:MAG: hypothetical protein COW00_18550 [Bdellovibrio sp. CG12_big_fil_rev_8_21_14_0_65_39_13]|nr:MAG: hypothetical protein COW78_08325 [Bdellovibrio sp. CG22_combo_CG10-13_8_21_14_all_39_27]PIQ57882.1 MAG: hypothetical protein COW00_18550 [Bdellovibrio sp. CG12_big_fil_rev_8_21_14_0_65_39_13]PIR34551.1 MAG: hypothetical protein COV37_12625 [Bdellovibrio sp. CG11_big_fil_rev_8_21_14_0_20_39_38]